MTNNSTPKWKRALLPTGSTLKQAIANLNSSAQQIALVVAEGNVLQGTVTDGDVRRGLLRGMDMNSPVDEIIFRDPLVVTPEIGRDMVLHLMRANKVHQIPVVDEQRVVVGLHSWDNIGSSPVRPNTMVIMAGGRGVRLRPHTEHCPKPLLPVAGKPMLEHIIERAKVDGFVHFVLAIHYLGHMIEDYFGSGDKWDVRIEYLREKTPLGTAGALGLLTNKPTDPVLVSNGDVLTDIRYGELVDYHNRHQATATMAVRLHQWQHPFGVVKTKGVEIIGFEEKPTFRTHVNAGVYVLDPKAFNFLSPDKHYDMPGLFEKLRQEGERVVVYPMHEPWLDVGRCEDYDQANSDLERLTLGRHHD